MSRGGVGIEFGKEKSPPPKSWAVSDRMVAFPLYPASIAAIRPILGWMNSPEGAVLEDKPSADDSNLCPVRRLNFSIFLKHLSIAEKMA